MNMIVVAFGSSVVGMMRATGKRVWEHRYKSSSSPRLTVTDTRVIVLGYGLSCLDLATGNLRWEAPAFSGTMLCDGAHVFIGNAGEVRCFDIDDGHEIWADTFKGMGVYPVALAIPGAASQIDETGN